MSYEEDEFPMVEPVKGVKYSGTRYNSEKGFIYHLQKKTSKHNIYHCKYHKKLQGGCKARVKSGLEDAIFSKHGDAKHNHPLELEEQQLLRVVNACADAAAVDRRKPRIVFDAVRRENAGVNIGYGDAMQRRMQRSKRRRQPQIPKTVEEIAGLIEEYQDYRDAFGGGRFFRGLVKTVEGEALVFLSPTLLPELSEATELQADATFRTVPGLFKQLFTIHITRGHLAFPFAYILMTRKSRILYDAVLAKVIDIFDELHPDNSRFDGGRISWKSTCWLLLSLLSGYLEKDTKVWPSVCL
ncbi:uncharacterized protein LOC130693893 [Daphnia carinata]|uniref:uncharacterized protein LOC130693893 n=1 Tax=Daphnia carinata TaxID=120202 RepID=UPI00257D5B77|nr:uncharacterized protein LOC130693893 [Daphnia carinata]